MDTHAWSPQQSSALLAVSRWLKTGTKGQQVFRVFGFAGTGKTTLAIEFARELGFGAVRFAAYTGKAASVLRAKKCKTATTIHQLAYNPEGEEWNKKTEQFDPVFSKKSIFLENLKLIVLDECSMLDESTAKDLMAFGRPILVLGDPAQLPPLGSAGYFTHSKEFPTDKPDVLLTEIHRQAKDSPILQMATDVRLGKGLKLGSYGNSKVVRGSFDETPYNSEFQTICGTNRLRAILNEDARDALGFEGDIPQVGEKLVCLRNDKTLELLNGEIYTVTKSEPMKDDRYVLLSLLDSGGVQKEVKAWLSCLRGEDMKSKPYKERCWAQEFNYGYALTCHKSQGSQYDHTLVMDESYCFQEDAQRWLYTALTRAAKVVRVVRRR